MKGIIYGIMALLLLSMAYAADGGTLSGTTFSGTWGDHPSGTVTFTNTGNTTLNGTTSITITSGTWSATLNPTSFTNLLPGAQRVITVNANIPSTHALGTFYSTVTVTYTGDSAQAVTSTAALTVNPEVNAASFTATSNLDFGSSTQTRGGTLTGNINLRNNGNTALTIAMSSTLASIYETSFGQSSVTLQPGESQNVPVTIKVPLSQSSGANTLTGGFVATATNVQGLSRTTTAALTVENNLVIDNVEVEYDDESEDIAEGEVIDDEKLKPDTQFTITVKAKNTFTSTQGYEMRDIEVNVEGSGDLDLDDSDDLDDLEDGDKDELTFTATIPDDADDGDTYDVDIRVDGTDENGARHSDSLSFEIEINKESHLIEIKEIRVNPETVSCNGGKVNVEVNVENAGKYDEDEAAVRMEVDGMEVKQTQYNINIDEDDDYTKTFTFNVPSGTPEGEYSIFVTTFYDGDEDSETETATFNVQCKSTTIPSTPSTPTKPSTPSTPTTPSDDATPVVPVSSESSVGTASFEDSPAYIAVLAGGVLVLLVIVIAVVVKFF